MSRKQLLAVFVGVAISMSLSAGELLAAKFSVYYRTTTASPWVYYAGKESRPEAQTTANELKELGYLTEIVADAEPAPSTVVTPSPTGSVVVPAPVGAVVDGGSYLNGTRVVTNGNRIVRSNYAGHVITDRATPGSLVRSGTRHHYNHAHAHHHNGPVVHHAHHPTHHPHHHVNHHHKLHAAHHAHPAHHAHHHHGGGHHAHHHGGHHAHHHPHHHAHAHHHHGKK
jgi:hypothetical protein